MAEGRELKDIRHTSSESDNLDPLSKETSLGHHFLPTKEDEAEKNDLDENRHSNYEKRMDTEWPFLPKLNAAKLRRGVERDDLNILGRHVDHERLSEDEEYETNVKSVLSNLDEVDLQNLRISSPSKDPYFSDKGIGNYSNRTKGSPPTENCQNSSELSKSNEAKYGFNEKERVRRANSESPRRKSDTENYPAERGPYVRSLSDTKGDRQRQKSTLIRDGKEVADLIVGSHRALDCFMSFYDEWAVLRMESTTLLEQLRETIIASARKNDKIADVLGGIDDAAGVAELVPNPLVSLGTKIAAAFSKFVAKLFGSKFSKKDVEAREFEIRQIFQKDIDTSSLVYIYGIQCVTQFEETRGAIRKFHRRLQEENFNAFMDDGDVLEFLNEISEYSPLNESVFYKRLRWGYEKLVQNSKSDESRAFIRVFEDMPAALRVINLLAWRFDTDGFDNGIVQDAWVELFTLFHNSATATVDLFLSRIQDCLFFLNKERKIIERSVMRLLNEKM